MIGCPPITCRALWWRLSSSWISSLTLQYRGAGSEAYHPQMLAAVLLYGYATGTYSSRKIEEGMKRSLSECC